MIFASIGKLNFGTTLGTSPQDMTVLSVNGVNLLCPIAADNASFGNGVVVKAPDGRIYAGSGTSSTSLTSFLNALISRINACSSVNGGPVIGGYTTPSVLGTTIQIIAPVALGDGPNGQPSSRAGTVGSLSKFIGFPMGSVQVGHSYGGISTSALAMTGGQDLVVNGTTRIVRKGVGAFSRTDIVSSINSYPKGPKRSDCAGATCTYDEEMTNVANWFAYYRTRMLMMKTSVGRAFVPVDTNYRVGFITICPIAGPCGDSLFALAGVLTTKDVAVDASKYLKIDLFTAPQKNAWYTKLYATTPLGGTPLREALARVGAIYAGKFGSGLTTGLTAADDPITRSCQPNFALLATDGYWNGGPGYKEDGTTLIGNQDNANVGPFSLQTQGVFDGGTPTASDTLADVALYYYQTDLRPQPKFSVFIGG